VSDDIICCLVCGERALDNQFTCGRMSCRHAMFDCDKVWPRATPAQEALLKVLKNVGDEIAHRMVATVNDEPKKNTMDLAKKCPGCGDLAIKQIINEFHEPEWWAEGWKDDNQEPIYICFCPFCGHKLQDPKDAPVRVDLTKFAQQLLGTKGSQ
jgi:hypothetical protein